jgi:hypothetical protein
MPDHVIIFGLALVTLVLVGLVALTMRARVAARKGDPKRSALLDAHGGAPRPNRPGTEH